MATLIDPFVIPVPDKYKNNLEEYAYHDYLVKTMQQIIERIGGPGSSDAIDDLEMGELYEEGSRPGWASSMQKQIDDLGYELDILISFMSEVSKIKKDIISLEHSVDSIDPLYSQISSLSKKIQDLEVLDAYI